MKNLRTLFRTLAVLVPLALLVVSAPAARAAAPTITSLSPNSAVAGGAAFKLTINGTNFTKSTTAQWGTTALTPTYISATQLTTPITVAQIAKAGTYNVTVTTGGVTSAASAFTVNPASTISSLSPNSAVAGGASFKLTINGTDFTKSTKAKWGTTALKPTYVSATQLTAPITAAQIAKAGTYNVTVTTGGVTSAASAFTVNPASTISSLSPSSAVAGGAAFTLTINGANFTKSTKAKWGTTALTPTYVSATQLTAPIPASLIAKAGTYNITVTTGGVTSAASAFTVNPASMITNLSPNSAVAGGAAFTLTINGTNFTKSTTAKWSTTALTPTYVSATQLTASIPASLIAKAGIFKVTVTTGGVTSVASTFTVNSASMITSLSPRTAVAGGASFTLTINGAHFTSATTAQWGTTALKPTYVSATQLTAPIPASFIAKAGAFKVTVTTGGVTSAASTFTVTSASMISSLSPKTAVAGGASFTLTINGAHFTSATTAQWGTTALTPTYVSATQLTAPITAAQIAKAGAFKVTVTTGGVTSAASTFTVTSASTITSLSPSTAAAGGAAFTLTINGTNFTSASKAYWGTTALATTYLSAAKLTAAIPASLIAQAGTVSVTVTTSGVATAGASFTITGAHTAACANDGSGNAKLLGSYSFQYAQTDPTNSNQLNLNLGAFTADGQGNISSGVSDSNGPYFTSERQGTFTGSYSIGSDDRGLLTLINSTGSTSYFCFALDSLSSGVAGSGRLVSDDTNTQINSGAFYVQGTAGLAATSLKGSWAFGLQGVQIDSSTGNPTRGAEAGYLTLDNSGNVTAGEVDVSQDAYSSGALTNNSLAQVAVKGTYTQPSNGRGTLTLNLTGNGADHYAFYLAGTNQILLLSTDAGGQGGSAVTAGKAYLRTATSFGNATLTGSSVVVGQSLTNTNSSSYNNRLIKAGIASWSGAGSVTETLDQNDAGTVNLQQASSGSYAVDASGRVTLSGITPTTVAYLVGVNQGFAVGGNLGVDFQYFENQTMPSGGFSLSSFNGGYSDGSLWYGYEQQKAKSGEVTADGAGNMTGGFDVDPLLIGGVDAIPVRELADDPDNFTVKPMDQAVTETYNSATTGRFVINNNSGAFESLFLVSPSKAYALDISGASWQPIEELNHQ